MKTKGLIIIMMLSLTAMSFTDVPQTINFQGALKDANGEPVNSSQLFEFRIYNTLSAGSPVWTEQHFGVPINTGIFSVELGLTTPFPVDMFINPELYITYILGGETTEMTPRRRILSVPYSLMSDEAYLANMADNSDHLGGIPPIGFVQQDSLENAIINGTMTANAFVGDGSGLTGITGVYDSLYIHSTGPDTMIANSPYPTLSVGNGSGDGIYIDALGDGIYVNQSGISGLEVANANVYGVFVGNAGDGGVKIHNAGNPAAYHENPGKSGFEVSGSEGDGLYVGYSGVDGVHIKEAADNGMQIEQSGNFGVRIDSTGNDGVFVYHAGNPTSQTSNALINGFEVAGAENYGVYVGYAGSKGVVVNKVGNPSGQTFSVSKSGLEIAGAEGEGVFIGQADDDGVYVYHAGNPADQHFISSYSGFEVAGAEGDGLYVGYSGIDGVHVKEAADNGLHIEESADFGVRIDSTGNDGIYIRKVGNPSAIYSYSNKNGLEIAGAEDDGISIGRADHDGIYINSAGYTGVYIDKAGNPSTQSWSGIKDGFSIAGAQGNGLFVGQADGIGVRVVNAGNPSDENYCWNSSGFEVDGAEGHGLFVGHADCHGVKVESADSCGVWANTTDSNGEYGIYTPDKIAAEGGFVVPLRTTIGRNSGSEILESGDIVCLTGYEENVLGVSNVPLINVSKADSYNSNAVIGVVEYRVSVSTKTETSSEKTIVWKSFRHVEGNAGPGDYISIITEGPADVKVEFRENINIGESLTAGNGLAEKVRTTEINGITVAENVGILGKALEDSNGKSKIKVYVNCK